MDKPQIRKNGSETVLDKQDIDIKQKYYFSSTKEDNKTYQLNNLMEISNRILLDVQEIKKKDIQEIKDLIPSPSTGVIIPEQIDNKEILNICTQTKLSTDKIADTVAKMSDSQVKTLTDPNTTWTDRVHIVLSVAITSAEACVVRAALEAIGAFPWIVNNIRRVLYRRTGNYNFELPVVDPPAVLTAVIPHGGELRR